MYKILRFFNQNKENIIKVILIVTFILGLIQLFNFWAGNKNVINNESSNFIASNNISNKLEDKIISNKSAITGDTIDSKQLEENGNIINNFMTFCNDNDIEAAYNLISDDCKKEMYPTEKEFYTKYYKNIFNNNTIIYSIENWFDDTYKVEMSEDILVTGNVSKGNKNLDYITIVETDTGKKLNINSFIGKKEINKDSKIDNINVTVIEKNIYMDYEIYKLKVQNNTNNKICLDTKETTNSIYLENNKNAKFYSIINEIEDDTLIIGEKYTNEIEIKFNVAYSSNNKIKDMIFERVILDYKKYISSDKEEYNDYYILKIEL